MMDSAPASFILLKQRFTEKGHITIYVTTSRLQLRPLYVFDGCKSNFSFTEKWGQYTANDIVSWSSHSDNLIKENRLVSFGNYKESERFQTNLLLLRELTIFHSQIRTWLFLN